MTNVFHSLKIRCTDFSEASVQDGLVKNWTLRGTVHVFAEDDLPLFIFNLAGIVMPALMVDGNVVGRYKKKDRKLTITLFKPLSEKDKDAVSEKAGTLWDGLAKIEWE